VGPNGAGKSTLLKIAAGLLAPSNGLVALCDRDMTTCTLETKKDVGYLPENAACYEDLTARENMLYFCALRGLEGEKARKRTEKLLKIVDLAREKKVVRQFSKGMRQRLGIAVSLIGRPKAVLWDEPSSGLDPSGRLLLRDIITSLKKDGASVLISSHDLRESALLADRVCLLYNGRIRFLGKADGPELECKYRDVVDSTKRDEDEKQEDDDAENADEAEEEEDEDKDKDDARKRTDDDINKEQKSKAAKDERPPAKAGPEDLRSSSPKRASPVSGGLHPIGAHPSARTLNSGGLLSEEEE
jgi:ABC-2 type transport system ATP-binding protein